MQKITECQWILEINENNGKRPDEYIQRLSLCHIGLAKDHGGRLASQPTPLITNGQALRNNSWK